MLETMTLHQALAALGLTTRPSVYPGKKIITDAQGNDLGHFDSTEGWALVHKLSAQKEAA